MTENSFVFLSMRMTGNRDESLLAMVKKLREHRLEIPPFQRKYVWPDSKLTEWIKTVIDNQAIGIIVTYQVKGDGPEWLADGLQRLTATRMFLDNPERYGFKFSKEQAEDYCEKYQISVQHRHYSSHNDAMYAFKNLNRGTYITPEEYHKGELTIEAIGDYAYKAIKESLGRIETSLMSGRSAGRNPESKRARDSLGLFLQYISEFQGTELWNVGRINKDDAEISIEKRLLERIYNWSERDVDSKIKDFETFMLGEVALFRQIMREKKCEGIAFSPAAIRFLFHLSLWRKNNNRPRHSHEEWLRKFFSLPRSTKTISSRIMFPGNPIISVTLDMDSLRALKILCELMKSDLYIPEKRNNNKIAAIGCHVSHIDPISIFGNGETIIEPAPINIARGARSI